MNFLPVSAAADNANSMPTSKRLFIYGNGLPNPALNASQSVSITLTIVFYF
jgi:hypothetical protein